MHANDVNAWALINTVEDCKCKYTKIEYHHAVLTRKVQNIIMFPGVCEYTKITDSKLIANCKVGAMSLHNGCREDFWNQPGGTEGQDHVSIGNTSFRIN
jgi:hypothetical protein